MKQITVIKFGGSLSKNKRAMKRFFGDMAKASKKGGVVLVHGGGPEINLWLERLGIKPKFVGGLRFTDSATLEIVEMALDGRVNRYIVSELTRLGLKAVGISGKDGKIVQCSRIKKLGFVGEPSKVDTGLIKVLLSAGYLPVVSSLGFGAKGETLNVNADSFAMALACNLKAEKLILLTDVPGVLDENKKTIDCIKTCDIEKLLSDNIITGGMIPKIKACSKAIFSGVKEVWIVDGAKGINKLKGTVIR